MYMGNLLIAESLKVGYEKKTVIEDLSITIPENKISVIIGSNGCGKSTLLKSFSRLNKVFNGLIKLNSKSIYDYKSKDLSKILGLLPQSPVVPVGIKVYDLVARGRFPHRKFMQGMSMEDFKAVDEALEMMGITDIANTNVDELSGGQRQRVWIALLLAQDTNILLLDEPTTYLDIAYQVEILDLLVDLNRKKGTTILMILHDINLSARYADYIFAMKNGGLIAEGIPNNIINRELIKTVFDLDCNVVQDPVSKTPMIVPIGRHRA